MNLEQLPMGAETIALQEINSGKQNNLVFLLVIILIVGLFALVLLLEWQDEESIYSK